MKKKITTKMVIKPQQSFFKKQFSPKYLGQKTPINHRRTWDYYRLQ